MHFLFYITDLVCRLAEWVEFRGVYYNVCYNVYYNVYYNAVSSRAFAGKGFCRAAVPLRVQLLTAHKSVLNYK